MHSSITIVGASLAGVRAAEALRSEGFEGVIKLIGDEAHVPYDRPPLSKSFLEGAMTSERVSAESKIFEWFNLVAYSTLAALLGRIIVFPAGILASADLIIRLVVLVACILIYILSKKNLVLPTILSAILLSILMSL